MIDKKIKHIHFVGIKGVAMTALAVLAKETRIKVTGSDTKETFVTDSVLKEKGIKPNLGFKKDNIKGRPDLIIVTGAHGGLANIEAKEARKKGLAVMTHAQALALFMEGNFGISVGGVGGKSTTASMIATILAKSGTDPSYAIGVASIKPLGAGGHSGKGKYFVAEADEYVTDPKNDLTPRFMWQNPKVIVITNIEYDHPDVYQNLGETKKTYLEFANKITDDGFLVVCGDNKNIRQILPKIRGKVLTYGFNRKNDYLITKVEKKGGDMREWWDLRERGNLLARFEIKVPGEHNILNATAAITVGLKLGISRDKIKSGILSFGGVKRRFEYIGKVGNVSIYDDYAHHPTEIIVTLKTARKIFPHQRIICIFQPHTYSRTKALFSDFAKSFGQADLVIITDIYPSAREKEDPSVSMKKLVDQINQDKNFAKHIKTMDEVVDYLPSIVRPKDIIFTIGAGDIFNYQKKIIKKLKQKYQ